MVLTRGPESMKANDLARIGALIKAKRRRSGQGLRAAAEDCGVSSSTLSRLERGDSSSFPDAETLTKLAHWLHTTVSAVLSEKPKQADDPELTTPEVVEVHLRADKRLSADTATALGRAFRLLYDQMAKDPKSEGRNG
jgi:transcriptional regulator with XRE-family HTH domain